MEGWEDRGEPSLTPFMASVIVKIGRWKHPFLRLPARKNAQPAQSLPIEGWV